MRKEELEKFKQDLLERKRILVGDVDRMADEALKSNQDNSSRDFNNMADMGSDNFDQDFTIGLMEKEQDELREIDTALERMAEGKYGTCGECGAKIGKERLKALPHAQLCINCKTTEEQNGSPGR